jgi:hypothetical protein
LSVVALAAKEHNREETGGFLVEEVRQDRNGGCGARRDAADGTNPVSLHRLTTRKTLYRARKKV